MNIFSKIFKSIAKKEKVVIYTEDYEVEGWLYNPGLSTRRFLSDLLNGANKNFVAVTDCDITYAKKNGQVEHLDFLQLNMRYIVLIKPVNTENNQSDNNNFVY